MPDLAIPALTTAQMREVERLMVAELGIDLPRMMENAGRSLAWLAKRMLDGELQDRPIVVLAGRGNNGGGGLAAARHLLNCGAWVQVVCSYPPEVYEGVPAQQLAILQAMGVSPAWAEEGWELPPADLLIDAVIGYGLRGDPRGKARDLIHLANSSVAPILSLDVPSGVDSDGGLCYAPHMVATATLTLALPKRGLLLEPARQACGDLYVADIGVPPALYARLGLEVPSVFARDPILPLDVIDGVAVVRAE
jgi:NAD(P)H-hydrate epimerase